MSINETDDQAGCVCPDDTHDGEAGICTDDTDVTH